MKFIPNHIEKYCIEQSKKDSKLLDDLTDYTKKNIEGSEMLCGPLVGSVLQGIICMIQAKKILEIGTYTGYSALKMAEVLPSDGTIDTCELGDNHCQIARKFFKKSPFNESIKIHRGKALESINKFSDNYFDMVFIDADKINYKNYYKKSLNLVKKGGVIVLDNMLWSGNVIQPNDEQSKSLRNTADFINNDIKCFNFLMPVRDGLMVCIKK
ncbi:MAG: methyltransferase [Candidatus Marinimicrobia bacterium]|jgi:caffeoyl-CoA O-methyltransferase|nr:methyltransferase [Candidatus Neomarinimicrobiota bacterium]|tara:strand:- start:1043 stop:1678 length:636 start_codon:yes stop_codon:yes gene_type:complete